MLVSFINNIQKQYAKDFEEVKSSLKINNMIIDEWEKIKEKFGDNRRTKIIVK